MSEPVQPTPANLDDLELRIYQTLLDLESAEYIFTDGMDVVWTQGAIKRLAAEMRDYFR